ncbi:DUF2971 domain-containing protein [Larkinella harenae]
MSQIEFSIEVKPMSREEYEGRVPQTLYKYRDWKVKLHRAILTRQEIFFSNPITDFLDERDCRIPIEFDDMERKMQEHALQTYKGSGMTDDEILRMAKYYFDKRFSTPEKIEERKKEYYMLINHSIGVYCVCQSNDNISMWQGYANNNTGFCVGISLNDAFKTFHSNKIYFNPITYVKESFPKLQWVAVTNDTFDQVLFNNVRNNFTKYDKWRYEDEFRIVRMFDKDFPQEVTIAERVFRLPKSCFKEIVFGAEMDKNEIDEIVQVCKNEQLYVKYKQSKIRPDGTVVIEDHI